MVGITASCPAASIRRFQREGSVVLLVTGNAAQKQPWNGKRRHPTYEDGFEDCKWLGPKREQPFSCSNHSSVMPGVQDLNCSRGSCWARLFSPMSHAYGTVEQAFGNPFSH